MTCMYTIMSSCILITLELIERHLDWDWKIKKLSQNPFTKSLSLEKKELFLQSCCYSENIKKSFTHHSLFDRNLLEVIMQFV